MQQTANRKNNKYQRSRYRALDRCLRNQHQWYYIEDLIKACNEALLAEYDDPEVQVSRRTVFNDLNYMESNAGYAAIIDRIREGKRIYYRYADPDFSIEKLPLTDDELSSLSDTVMMLSRLRGMPQFGWMGEVLTKIQTKLHLMEHHESVIGFDVNDYIEGLQYLEPIFQAIVNRQGLEIDYQPFGRDITTWQYHPYYIKQYNNRWFVIGLNQDSKIMHIALDRIRNVRLSNIAYIPTDIDFTEYFDDVIGVTIYDDAPIEDVVLRFSEVRFPYVETKPLHHSQTVIDRDTHTIRICVRSNPELKNTILSYGADVEVLSPEHLRQEISHNIEKMHSLYLQCK